MPVEIILLYIIVIAGAQLQRGRQAVHEHWNEEKYLDKYLKLIERLRLEHSLSA